MNDVELVVLKRNQENPQQDGKLVNWMKKYHLDEWIR